MFVYLYIHLNYLFLPFPPSQFGVHSFKVHFPPSSSPCHAAAQFWDRFFCPHGTAAVPLGNELLEAEDCRYMAITLEWAVWLALAKGLAFD